MEDIEYELLDLDWNLEYDYGDQEQGTLVKDDSEIVESSNKPVEFKTDENHIPLGITKE